MQTDMILDKPNLMTVKDCRENIKYYTRIKLSLIKIPALLSDLSSLAENLNSVDQNANDILLKVGSAIDTSRIKAAVADLEELEGAVLAVYERDLAMTLDDKKKTLIGLRNELFNSTYNLKTMSYTTNTFRLQDLSTTRANLQAIEKREKDEDHYDLMLQKKQALDLAIEAYQSESLYDKFSPIIGQIDNVVKASESPATFKKELIREGVQAAKTILKLVDAALKYDDMLEARTDIIKKINARNDRMDDIDRQIKANFDEITQLQIFESLRKPKAQYVDEVEKILKSFDTFTNVVFAECGTVEIADNFVKHAPTLKKYANDLSPRWLRG